MTYDSIPQDPAAGLCFADTRRPSQRLRHPAWPASPWRALLVLALVLLHTALFTWLLRALQPREAMRVAPPLLVLSLRPPARLPPPSPPPPRGEAASIPLAAAPAVRVPVRRPPAIRAAPPDVHDAPLPTRTSRLFRDDGSIALPDTVIDDLAAVTDPRRRFSYQVPGALQARDFLRRPPALVYEATRFDAAWVDEKDLFTEALEKAVEKTTATISLPVPRSPGTRMVCKVSLLGLGGACGFVNNGQGYLVMLDDPDTLDADEDAQCRRWWDGIVAAKTAEAWRDAFENYEAQCRKPLLSPPLPPAADAARTAPTTGAAG